MHAGKLAFDASPGEIYLARVVKRRDDQPTRREFQVLQEVAKGSRNAEIAALLGVRRKTIEFHMGNLRQRVAAHSRVELVEKARRCGWLS